LDKEKITVFVDTNVFIIDLRYKNDINYKTNRSFLNFIAKQGKGITSIVNLLELCGILSFNLNRRQISELFHYFPEKYGINVIPSHDINSFISHASVKEVMDIIYKKASFGDALIANLINNTMPDKTVFISWDAEHFKELLSVRALTPKEFLL
jgi:predicted nucleic acid-binding protein